MVEALQMALRNLDGDLVDTEWAYQIACGAHGLEQTALRNFIQSGPSWMALKSFIRNKFVPARNPKLQQMEALNEKPLPGELITTYTNRWFNGVNHTWVEQLREAGSVEFLGRALIFNCTSPYNLNATAVMLLNQNLLTLVSNTFEPQSIFLKVQAQLIELVGTLPASTPPKNIHSPQASSTSPSQVYRARIAIDEPCLRYQQGRCRFAAGICDRLHVGATSKFGSAPPINLGDTVPVTPPARYPNVLPSLVVISPAENAHEVSPAALSTMPLAPKP